MNEHIILTIGSKEGIKQYNLPSSIKKFVSLGLIISAVGIASTAFYIKNINGKVSTLEEKNKALSLKYIKKENLLVTETDTKKNLLYTQEREESLLARLEVIKKNEIAKLEDIYKAKEKELLAKYEKNSILLAEAKAKEALLTKAQQEVLLTKTVEDKMQKKKIAKIKEDKLKKNIALLRLEKEKTTEKQKDIAKEKKVLSEKKSLPKAKEDKKKKVAKLKEDKAKKAKALSKTEKSKKKKTLTKIEKSKTSKKVKSSKTYNSYSAFKKNTNLKKSFKVYEDKKLLAKAHGGNTKLKVDISDQRVRLYVGNKVAIDSPCTTGSKRKFEPNTKIYRDKRTPKGNYKIMEKISDKRSSIFGDMYRNGKKVYHGDRRKYKGPKAKYKGASLKNWMRLTSSGIGLHASKYIKRYPGTNGCIRLPYKVARTIFKKVKKGTKVSIVN